MSFDITKCPVVDGYKRCQTRSGRPVRILCENLKSQYNEDTIAIAVKNLGGEWLETRRADGRMFPGAEDSEDLVNLEQEWTGWANVYKTSMYCSVSEYTAKTSTNESMILARVPITIKYRPGQGLEDKK